MERLKGRKDMAACMINWWYTWDAWRKILDDCIGWLADLFIKWARNKVGMKNKYGWKDWMDKDRMLDV